MIPIVAPVPLMIVPTAGGMVGVAGLGQDFLAVMEPLGDAAWVEEPVVEVMTLPDAGDLSSPVMSVQQSAMPWPVQPMAVNLSGERMFLPGGTERPVDQSALESQTVTADALDMPITATVDGPTETRLAPETVTVAVGPALAAPVFAPDLLPQMDVGIDVQRPIGQPVSALERHSVPFSKALPMGVAGPIKTQQQPISVAPDVAIRVQATVTQNPDVVPHRTPQDMVPVPPTDRPAMVLQDAKPIWDHAATQALAPQKHVVLRADAEVVLPPQIFAQPEPAQSVPQVLQAQIPKGHSALAVQNAAGNRADAPPLADIAPLLGQHVASVPRPTTAERAFATRVSQTVPYRITPTETVAAPPDGKVAVAVDSADFQVVVIAPNVAPPVVIDATAAPLPIVPIPAALPAPVSPPDIPLLRVAQTGDRPSIAMPIPWQALPATVAQIASAPGNPTVEIRLDPVELGAVQVTMQGTERDMSIVVMVERPDTLDLLRRHADQFLADLRQSGFSGTNLTFNLSDQNGAAQRQSTPPPTLQQNFTPQPTIPDPRPVLKSTGGLDMRL